MTGTKILPTWLLDKGIVKKVQLLECYHHYAVIQDESGAKKSVSIKDLSPFLTSLQDNDGSTVRNEVTGTR